MNFKTSLLAASVALVLAGCGSDDSAPVVGGGSQVGGVIVGQFIDAAVEGLTYTTSSGLSGLTDNEGQYSAKQTDTITFYLGGENGIKIGAASNRGVITPFEAAGKYGNSINLAILLQSLDIKYGSNGDDVLTIPEKLQSLDDVEIATLLDKLDLNDIESVLAFLNDPLIAATPVSEAEAIEHMKESFKQNQRGDDALILAFALDSGKVIRNISTQLTVQNTPDSSEAIYVHADKTQTAEEFNETRGMSVNLLQMTKDHAVVLAGSNDGSQEEYINDHFTMKLVDPAKLTTEDDRMPWTGDDAVPDFGPLACADSEQGCTASTLNALTDIVRDDTRPGESGGPNWQREIQSGFYDPITGLNNVVRKKIDCTSNDVSSCDGRTTTYLDFYYEVPNKSEDRYVDFTGDWVSTSICDNGEIAKMQFSFTDADLTISGTECKDDAPGDIGKETHDYAALANMDYWWFNQTDRVSKATLTELNSVVRFCDDNDYNPGDSCSNEFFVKWEYQPAGKAWDEGLLIRHKLLPDGTLDNREVMQKTK
ncbi:hypothetical protein [Enterovibrio calviensis]|uniref:hypothetical protein n=1 Tax=Enterovibrio calviensis TaxID=91359 RepID=UPI0037366D7E